MDRKKKKPFNKSLTSSSHPISPQKVEMDKTKYNRRKNNEQIKKELNNS